MRMSDHMGEGIKAPWDAIVAHQLKTPLCAMDADLRTAKTVDKAKLRQEISRLTQLIDQIQLFARCRGEDVDQRKDLSLGDAVGTVVTELAPLACDRGLTMIFRDLSRGCMIRADPVLADEAIRNVVENAIKYSPAKGIINAITMSNGHVCILDRGPGVPAIDREAVFEPFRRGSSDRPGAGLGLFLVREIMRHENGHAMLYTRRGGGSAAVLGFECAAG
ncbi:MAG: HAMP domain-containing sensor histidine kinase [Pseudomonadota bacterium]